MTDATVWCEAGFDNFRGGGFSSHYTTRAEMPATMIRLNLVKGLGPVLQIAEGWTVKLPDDVSDKLMERTNPTWPCTWFAPRCDGKEGSPFRTAYEVMQNWGANHGAISYGHIGADLITLCSMLRMLNSVDAENVEDFNEGRATELMLEKANLQKKLDEISEQKQKQINTQSRLDDIFKILDGMENHPMKYNDQIIRQLLECVIVESKTQIRIVFTGGLEIVENMG